jgi:hypothetical protein
MVNANLQAVVEAEPDYEALSAAVQKISAAMAKINQTRMTRKMLTVLIYDMTKVSKGDINAVLDGLEGLERHYLKRKSA